MKPEILILPLEIKRTSPAFKQFERRPPAEKLDLILQRIHELCHQLMASHPTAKWIIVLREYAIITADDWRPVSKHFKDVFKNAFMTITDIYPQLAIIAGTIVTTKFYGEGVVSKVTKIKNAYDDHSWMLAKEEKYACKSFQSHLNAVQQILDTASDKVDVFRNTCYIFDAGKVLSRIDKKAPFNECGSVPSWFCSNPIFQLGKGRNASPVFTLKLPTGESIEIGVEICRDHGLKVLEHYLQQMSAKKPSIHFLISDSLNGMNYVAGSVGVHIDSCQELRLIKTEETKEMPIDVTLLKNDLLSETPTLQALPRSFTIDEAFILNIIHYAILLFPPSSAKHQLLRQLLESCSAPTLTTELSFYLHIEDLLLAPNINEQLFDETQPFKFVGNSKYKPTEEIAFLQYFKNKLLFYIEKFKKKHEHATADPEVALAASTMPRRTL